MSACRQLDRIRTGRIAYSTICNRLPCDRVVGVYDRFRQRTFAVPDVDVSVGRVHGDRGRLYSLA